MAKTLTWLHISDLHAGKVQEEVHIRSISEALADDLRELRKEDLLLDLIFFTGDAAFGNDDEKTPLKMSEQYDLAKSFFTEILEACELEPSRLFLVPGNHDVDRKAVEGAVRTELNEHTRRKSTNVAYIESLLLGAGTMSDKWDTVAAGLQPYRDFLKDAEYDHFLEEEDDWDKLTYATRISVGGWNIGIVGLNSAWHCCDDRLQGQLWMASHWQLKRALSRLKSRDEQLDFSVALCHHPPHWLTPDEHPSFRRLLPTGARFLLHGHDHKVWVDDFSTGFAIIGASACYDREVQTERGSYTTSGYNIVKLNLDGREAHVWMRERHPISGKWNSHQIDQDWSDPKGQHRLRSVDRWLGPTVPTGSRSDLRVDYGAIERVRAALSDEIGQMSKSVSQKVLGDAPSWLKWPERRRHSQMIAALSKVIESLIDRFLNPREDFELDIPAIRSSCDNALERSKKLKRSGEKVTTEQLYRIGSEILHELRSWLIERYIAPSAFEHIWNKMDKVARRDLDEYLKQLSKKVGISDSERFQELSEKVSRP